MKKIIVSTTIHSPTAAIERFDAMKDWDLVVVGDLRTPSDYRLQRGEYLGFEWQQRYDPELSDAIGPNCIQRRNFGLLWAHDHGADVVALVDDDNMPYEHWGKNLLVGRESEVNYINTDLPAFDPVGATNHRHLWHRGFPLQLLSRRDYGNRTRQTMVPDVQADFWDGDPDIDAICRMEHAPVCRFDPQCFPLASNRPSPFNSQNTFLAGRLLKDYFLFPHVGRMDDIWAAYYLQAKGCRVVYGAPSVVQERNAHDGTRDMRQEFLGYEQNLDLVLRLAQHPEQIRTFLPERSVRAFELYRQHFQ
jgi:hypothetical protein